MDELILYQKMKAGDRLAFDKIFKIHYEDLVRFAYKKVDTTDIAEDIVQNVFIDFWTKKDQLQIESSLGAYLKRTVHNRCIDYFRKQKSIQKKEENLFQNPLYLNIASPEEELLSQENLAAIYAKIEALPPKSKIVFKLSRFDKLTYTEIAEDLNISVKTVEYHVSTALRILRKTIFIGLLFIFL